MLGVVFGYFVTSADELFAGEPAVQQILAAGAVTPDALTGAFVRTVLSLVGIIACVPGVQVLLRVRAEELEDRVEPVLAGAVARHRFYASHVLLALTTVTALVLLAGTVVAVLAGRADIGVTTPDVLAQAAATVPAVWTVVALAVALVGARPAASLAAWAVVLVSFLLTLLGPTFGLDDWVLGISPFWHVPTVTGGETDWTGPGRLSLVVVTLVAAGFAGFRHRDLAR